MARRALETSIRQALVFHEDVEEVWQHHFLLIPSGTMDGRWIVCDGSCSAADYDLSVMNLNDHRIIPLASGQELPQDKLEQIPAFDVTGPGELDNMLRRARRMTKRLGFCPDMASTGEGTWLFAEPALECFAKPVPEKLFEDDDYHVIREADDGRAVALVLVEVEGTDVNAASLHRWCYCVRVENSMKEQWARDTARKAVLAMSRLTFEKAERVRQRRMLREGEKALKKQRAKAPEEP